MPQMQKYNVRLPVLLLARIRKQAAREDVTISILIRTAIKRYLDEHDGKRRNA